MTQKIDLDMQSHLVSDINLTYMHRGNYISPNWCSDATALTIQPNSGKKLLVTRLSFVTYNPAADFTKTIKIEHYNGSTTNNILEATGYAPLLLTANRIDSFKIGTDDIILISWVFRNSIRLESNIGEYIKFTTSGLIDNTDKFYAGTAGIEY